MASTRKKRIRRSRTARGGKMINKIKTMRNHNVNYALLSKARANRVYNNLRSLHNVGIEQQIETFVDKYDPLLHDPWFDAIKTMVLSAITPEHQLEVNRQHANEAARLTKEHIDISAALQLSKPPSEMTYGLKEEKIVALNKKKQELEEKIAANHVLISPEQGKPIFDILKVLQKRNNYLINIVNASIADDAIKLVPYNTGPKNYIVPPISAMDASPKDKVPPLIQPITKDNVIFLKEWIHISHMIIHKMKEGNSKPSHIIIMYELTLKAAFAYHRYMQSTNVELNEKKDAKIACYSITYDYLKFYHQVLESRKVSNINNAATQRAETQRAETHRNDVDTFLKKLIHDRYPIII